jgi:hypothetical protein
MGRQIQRQSGAGKRAERKRQGQIDAGRQANAEAGAEASRQG